MSSPPLPTTLSLLPAEASNRGYPEVFRRLYHHLYSNSSVSRPERLIEDLSLLLLTKLAVEVNGTRKDFEAFLSGAGTADELLIHLRKAAPDLVDESTHFAIDDATARGALRILGETTVSDAPAYALGEAFQALIGPRLRGEKGQFFTPHTLVTAMVEVVAPKSHETVLDPACGTGTFLLETVSYWAREGVNPTGHIYGIEKDAGLARLAAAVLRIAYRGEAKVFARNSLDADQVPFGEESVDVIVTNPPFGARIGITDKAILSNFAFGHRWLETPAGWSVTGGLLDVQDPQVLFLEFCVRALKPGGRMGIVLPEGLFGNRRTGFIWDWLRARGHILALLDCPRTTFQPGTDTKTNVLFFEKTDIVAANLVPVAVALNCGHDRRGRTTSANGHPFPDDFADIAFDFRLPEEQRRWWHSALLDPYYVVPRFYSPQKPRDEAEALLIAGANTASLGELVERGLLTVRRGVEVGSESYGTGSIPFVRTSDISNFEISIDPTKSVDEAIYAKFAPTMRLEAGDVLMVVDGRYRIGATALLTDRNMRCVLQSHLRILGTPRRDALDPFALMFALNLPSVRQGIRNLVFVQSTLGTLGQRLYKLELPLLSGPGPWQQPVDDFRRALLARDEQLARLRAAVGQADDVAL